MAKEKSRKGIFLYLNEEEAEYVEYALGLAPTKGEEEEEMAETLAERLRNKMSKFGSELP